MDKCDVCHTNPSIGVACSAFTAMSMAFCVECLRKPAEQEGVFQYLWEDVAHRDLQKLHPSVFHYYTFVRGEYVSFADWAAARETESDVQEIGE